MRHPTEWNCAEYLVAFAWITHPLKVVSCLNGIGRCRSTALAVAVAQLSLYLKIPPADGALSGHCN